MCFRNPLSKTAYQLPSQDWDDDPESPRKVVTSKFVAIQMIELEMQLEQDCSYETILKLSNLYSQAIEHFDDQEDPKCFDIQTKLHRMLQRPDVQKVLSHPTGVNPESPGKFYPDTKADFESRKKDLAQIFTKTLETDKQNSVICSDIIGKETTKAQEVSEKVVNSLNRQESDLENRLNERRSSMKSRNLSFCSGFVEKSDVSAGGNRGEMQMEIEEFLESHFAQQSHAVSDVNVRYETEIQRLDGQGGVIAMVVEQMRKTKEAEVATLKKKFEDIRREGISIIKKKYSSEF